MVRNASRRPSAGTPTAEQTIANAKSDAKALLKALTHDDRAVAVSAAERFRLLPFNASRSAAEIAAGADRVKMKHALEVIAREREGVRWPEYKTRVRERARGPVADVQCRCNSAHAVVDSCPECMAPDALTFLTNGMCESTDHVTAEALAESGLDHGIFQGDVYPLTDAEAAYIADLMVDVAEGSSAALGYSVLLEDRKWAAPTIEYWFGDDLRPKHAEAVLAVVQATAVRMGPAVRALGGRFHLMPYDMEGDRHTLTILLPIERLEARFGETERYLAWLAALLQDRELPRDAETHHVLVAGEGERELAGRILVRADGHGEALERARPVIAEEFGAGVDADAFSAANVENVERFYRPAEDLEAVLSDRRFTFSEENSGFRYAAYDGTDDAGRRWFVVLDERHGSIEVQVTAAELEGVAAGAADENGLGGSVEVGERDVAWTVDHDGLVAERLVTLLDRMAQTVQRIGHNGPTRR